jgi:glycosyltransferase involved in cell wall biosynthesis
MRIAIVITNKAEYNITHYNTQEIGLGKELVKFGHDVDIFCFSENHRNPVAIVGDQQSGLTLHFYKGFSIPGRQTWPIDLQRLLSRRYYDFAHFHEYPWVMPALGSHYMKKRGTKTILIQGMYQDFQPGVKRLYNKLYDRIFLPRLVKSIDAVICKSEAARDYMRKKGFCSKVLHVIPVGLDVGRLRSNEESSETSVLIEKKLSPFKRRLLYVGLLEKRRNPFFLLQLLERLLQNSSEYVLVIVGQGPLSKDVRKYIQKKGLERHIIWINSILHEQIACVYKLTDIFLLPSAFEIFGMTLLEALYFNMKVITTPTGGANQIIRDEGMGHKLPLDTEKWTSAIDAYYRNGHSKVEGRQYIETNFSWPSIARQYTSLYQELS